MQEKKVNIVDNNADVSLSSLFQRIKRSHEIENCGAVVSFTGIVRGKIDEGETVKRLHFEAERTIVLKRLRKIRKQLLEKYEEVKDILLYHIIDDLVPSENIMFVLAASRHRKEGFQVVREAVERIKSEVPIWKKEVREEGSTWISPTE